MATLVTGSELQAVRVNPYGDALYLDLYKDGTTDGIYILEDNNPSNTPIAIRDDWGNMITWLYEDWDNGRSWTKTQAVESVSGGSFVIAIERRSYNSWTNESYSDWETVLVDRDGVIDWNTSEWNELPKYEQQFFREDLDGNGSIGPKYTQLTSDTYGDGVYVDEENRIYILDDNDSRNSYIEITDEWGNSQSHYYDEWDSGSTKIQAVESLESGGYIIAIKRESSDWWTGDTWTDWETVQLNKDGVINWNTSEWNDLVKREILFGQDVDKNGSIGPKYTQLTTDTYGDGLYLDEDNNVYILNNNDTRNSYLQVIDTWGSHTPSWLYEDWDGGSSKAISVESTDNGGYIIAIKKENSDWWSGESWTDWETKLIDWDGRLLDANSTWNQLSKQEHLFGHDVDLNGAIGPKYTQLRSDNYGDAVYVDEDRNIFILNDNDSNLSYLEITDEWGNSQSHLYDEWDGGSTKIQAVESLESGGYIIAIKREGSDWWSGDSWTDWETVQLNYEGKINWQSSTWNELSTQEKYFNQDLDGNGSIGPKYTQARANEYGDAVYIDEDNRAYILENNNPNNEYISIKDEWGWAVTWLWEEWNDGGSKKIQAVESLDEGGYIIAIKQENVSWDGSDRWNDWETIKVSYQGVIDWNTSEWNNLSRNESLFKEDVDGNGAIGVKYTEINTDTYGDGLYHDDDNNVYILKDNNPNNSYLLIKDEWGWGASWWEDWGDGSYKIHAIETTNDGYIAVLKDQGTDWWTGETWTTWYTQNINSDGIVDWNSNQNWGDDISDKENYFKQDINGDGSIGFNFDVLDLKAADTDGDRIAKNDDHQLYIYTDEGDWISIFDDWGNKLSVYENNQWDDTQWGGDKGSYEREAKYVERWDNGTPDYIADDSYLLAIRSKDTWYWGGQQETNVWWDIHEVSLEGRYDWDGQWGVDITDYEEKFGSDINEDGVIGFNIDSLEEIKTDTNGISLKRDSNENSLYIIDENNTPIPIRDQWGWNPGLEYDSFWEFGLNKREAWAVTEDVNGGYLLATKFTDEYFDFDHRSTLLGNDDGGWDPDNPNPQYWFNFELESTTRRLGENELPREGDQFTIKIQTDNVPDGSPVYVTFGGEQVSPDDVTLLDSNNVTYKSGGLLVKSGQVYDGNFEFSVLLAEDDLFEGKEIIELKIFTDPLLNDQVGETQYGEIIDPPSSTSSSWEILSLSNNGILDWDQTTWTDSITSYEKDFGQDLDGDGSIGFNLNSLTKVSTDTSGVGLRLDYNDNLFIEVSPNNVLQVQDEWGGSVSFSWTDAWMDGSYSSTPYAITQVWESNGDSHYKLAVKQEDVWIWDGTKETDISWEVHEISLDGVVNWLASEYSNSIANWEPKFDQDLNGDGDFTGSLNLQFRATDTSGVLLGEDLEGGLYIVDTDNNKQLSINDEWIEDSWAWEDGSYQSVAYSVVLNTNNTSSDTSDDYYQIAVKETHVQKDYFTGIYETDESWQIYAVDQNGYIDWAKSTFTESIASYESIFGEDLDNNGNQGINSSGLTFLETDTKGSRLKKDQYKSLFIYGIDNGQETTISIKDSYGGSVVLDYFDDWGSGTHRSEAVAVEKNSNGSYSLAVKHTNSDRRHTFVDWEILSINSNGIIDFNDWNSTIWTQDISTFENTVFKEDLDGNGSLGILIENLAVVGSDTQGDQLRKDIDGNFYIYTDSKEHILITEYWGGNAELEYQFEWPNGSFSAEALAVESTNFTNSAGDLVSDGYLIAIKNTSSWGDETLIDYSLNYLDSNGVIDDGKRIYVDSVGIYESIFDLDLDNDGSRGVNTSDLSIISTDSSGDLLKTDKSGAYYIVDDQTNEAFALVDDSGESPDFDYVNSGGTGNYSWSHTSRTYAVESITEDGIDKYVLAVKSIYTFAEIEDTSWETFKILKDENDSWTLDWSTASWSKGASKLELLLQQDLDGDGSIGSIGQLQKVSSDLSSSGVLGAALKKDSSGSLYIGIGDSNYNIVDSSSVAVNFDWQYTWSGETHKAESFAVEGVDSDADGQVDYYKLAIKHTLTNHSEKDSQGDGYQAVEEWETVQVTLDEDTTTAILDYSSFTYGDAKLHESDLNQDLDGDGEIWSTTRETLTQVDTDTKGTLAFLDSSQNLYLQTEGTLTKQEVLDESGSLISFNHEVSFGGSRSYKSEILAVESVVVSDSNYYKLLTKLTETINDSQSFSYETVNVNTSTMMVDWSTITWHENPKKLENIFSIDLDNDGEITTISSNSTTPVATDTNGARLRETSDGSLFIQDGDSTLKITGPDGGYIGFNVEEVWDNGSFKSEAIAVQKVGSEYKLAVRDTSVYSSSLDVSYQVFTLSSTGQINWNNVVFRTAAEINETEFNQDLTGDGVISKGSSSAASDVYSNLVNTSNIDASVVQKFGDTAQSSIVSIRNSQSNSTDNIEMFVKGCGGGLAKSSYDIDVKIVQEANSAVIAKLANDTGADSSNIKPLTGLIDFQVNIDDAKNYGKIVQLSWVLPEDTEDPKYLKRQPNGDYFDFVYDPSTGEGAQWDSDANVLTVSVKDNGRYDSDPTLGVVRDPAYITASGSDSSALVESSIESTTTTDSTSSGVSVATVNSGYTADEQGFSSVTGSAPVTVTAYTIGENTTLDSIKDYGGSLHAGDNLEETASSYKYQGTLDVNGDGTFAAIFTNEVSRRWVTAKIDSVTGEIDFDDNGAGGGTRVVGIYEDPLIAEGEANNGFLSDGVTPAPANFGVSEEERYVEVNGETIDRLALNNQVRDDPFRQVQLKMVKMFFL